MVQPRSRLFAGSALALCLLLAACGGSSVSSTASPSPTPSPAPPTSAPAAATPTSTGTRSPVATASLSATALGSPSPTSDPLIVDPAVILKHGYTASPRAVHVADGFGHTLYAFHGTCTGSADGYCQMMFFFIDTRYLGTDTANPSTAITTYQPAGVGSVSVTYATYGPQDALCCPTGKPATITYHWNGSRLIPSGTPPGH